MYEEDEERKKQMYEERLLQIYCSESMEYKLSKTQELTNVSNFKNVFRLSKFY